MRARDEEAQDEDRGSAGLAAGGWIWDVSCEVTGVAGFDFRPFVI
jgi:hypothetical protein